MDMPARLPFVELIFSENSAEGINLCEQSGYWTDVGGKRWA